MRYGSNTNWFYINLFRPLFTELSPDIWKILSQSSKMEYERWEISVSPLSSPLIEIHIDSSIFRLEMEFIGYIGEFNLSYEQLVNSEEKVTDL